MCNSNYFITGYFAVGDYEKANANSAIENQGCRMRFLSSAFNPFYKCMELWYEVLTYNFAAPRNPCRFSKRPIRNVIAKKRNEKDSKKQKELNTMTEYFSTILTCF